MPPLSPVSAPITIGREQELAAVRAFLREGGTLLLSGEAGIGKSRLVREAIVQATASDYQILQGSCYDRDRDLPFAPFLDMVQGYAAADPENARRLATAMPQFSRLLPDPVQSLPIPLASFAPDEERRRRFHEVTALLTTLAAERPLLVIIEDLHWSDDASLDLLLLLTRRASTTPFALLCTYRPDEPNPALSRVLAELDRYRVASEITLRPLSPHEVEQQLRGILGLERPAGTVFVHSLHGLTGGNPFFVEEVLRSLIAEGGVYPSDEGWQRKPLDQLRVPRSVGEAVERRTRLLSPAARELLTLAAVAGQRVEFALLQTLSGLADNALIAVIKELIAAQLIAEDAADRFVFRHALTRQAVYAGLLGLERRTIHARVAQAIESAGLATGDEAVETLAYHAFEAGDWERASRLSRFAGARARTLHASYAAVGHDTRALQADAVLGAMPDAEILFARAQAFSLLGDFSAARTDYEAVLAVADTNGNRRLSVESMLGLGLLWSGRDYSVAREWLIRAVELARSTGDPASLAHALNRLGNWHANQESIDEALRCHDEARAIFERIGNAHDLAETFDLLAMTHSLGSDLLTSQQAAKRAAELFTELGTRQGLAGVLLMTAPPSAVFELASCVGTATIADGLAAGERALAMAREIDWRSGEAFLLALLGEVLASGGEFGKALALLRESIGIAEELDHRQWIVQARWGLARLFGAMLSPGRERAELERVLALAREIASQTWINSAAAALASTLVRLKKLDEAESLLTETLTDSTPMRSQGQRLLWIARAELALARGDPRLALAILDRLYAATPNLDAEGDVPLLASIKATALSAVGELQRAEDLLRAAQFTARTHGASPSLRGLHIALADLLRQQGREDEAIAEGNVAAAIAERLAGTIADEELRLEYRRAAGLEQADSGAPKPASSGIPGGLTPREQEVAQQIATGRSNRQIASDLYVSERTVEAHVTNILRKLSLTSRAGIASWVTKGQGSTDAT